jgi:hypothetical protein
MEWELTILIMWDVMQHYWVSDFQNLKGMLAIIYPAMQCHIPDDKTLKCTTPKISDSHGVAM